MKNLPRFMHLAALTKENPSANCRKRVELSTCYLQEATVGDNTYLVVTSNAFKNAVRDRLKELGYPLNRSRADNPSEGPTVEYESYPDIERWLDDWLMGYMIAKPEDYNKHPGVPSKRSAIMLMNLALSTRACSSNSLVTQVPKVVGKKDALPPFQNDSSSALLSVNFEVTSFRYPVSYCLHEARTPQQREWMRAAIKVIGHLAGVAGNHARFFFTMEPNSFVARITDDCVANFNLYGWTPEGKFLDLDRLLPFGRERDLNAKEFVLAGDLVRTMSDERRASFEREGVKLYRNVQTALDEIAESVLPEEK